MVSLIRTRALREFGSTLGIAELARNQRVSGY
jgi:hypothetical protein